ncbi:MAG: PAS domain-containing protein [Lachnospiraceae bacterium]|nr:PAS domain-containing protein [Lachnospiraceae bacterium]
MELLQYFKSIMDEDKAPIVICDLSHTIIYINPSACKHYERFGGDKLLGGNLMECHNPKSREMILKILDWFKESKSNNRIYTYRNDKENKDVYMIALRDEQGELIGYYENHEYRSVETAKMYDFGISL